jgi:glutathionyl-hydroquinone reductase
VIVTEPIGAVDAGGVFRHTDRNMLVKGECQTDVEPPTDKESAFDRVTTSLCDWIRGTYRSADDVVADGPDPEIGRYHLYIARNCPRRIR